MKRILVTACHTDSSTQNHYAAQDLRCADLRSHVRRLGIRWPIRRPTSFLRVSLRQTPTRLCCERRGLPRLVQHSRYLSNAHARWLGVLSGGHQHHMRSQMQDSRYREMCGRSVRCLQAAVKDISVERLASPGSKDVHQCRHWCRTLCPAIEYLCTRTNQRCAIFRSLCADKRQTSESGRI